ncbi:MAG: protease complex subunit PrcB family protein [Verrucomicrobiales bacterium]|nr:protease complex subunit PrcB family protein [Verrucomicrobiales bacterium]
MPRHLLPTLRAFAGLGLAALLVGLGTGCASRTPPHKLTWRSVSRGVTSGLDQPRREVIRTEAEYYRLWASHAATLQRMALPPHVDFTREMVVVVALGNRPTGGYFVDVVDLELQKSTLRVLVSEREPRPGLLQMQQVTQPYQIVALPIVQARVEFKTVREQAPSRYERKVRDTPSSKTPVRTTRPSRSHNPPLRSPRDASSR